MDNGARRPGPISLTSVTRGAQVDSEEGNVVGTARVSR
jgi:hypothetical protein